MDPRIAALKSTTFHGRRFTRRQIADIQETVELFPNDSRKELSKTICENLNWTTPKGEYRVAADLRFLEHLEECGILTLPEKRNTAAKTASPHRVPRHAGRANQARWGPGSGSQAGPESRAERVVAPALPFVVRSGNAFIVHLQRGVIGRGNHRRPRRPRPVVTTRTGDRNIPMRLLKTVNSVTADVRSVGLRRWPSAAPPPNAAPLKSGISMSVVRYRSRIEVHLQIAGSSTIQTRRSQNQAENGSLSTNRATLLAVAGNHASSRSSAFDDRAQRVCTPRYPSVLTCMPMSWQVE